MLIGAIVVGSAVIAVVMVGTGVLTISRRVKSIMVIGCAWAVVCVIALGPILPGAINNGAIEAYFAWALCIALLTIRCTKRG